MNGQSKIKKTRKFEEAIVDVTKRSGLFCIKKKENEKS